MKRLLVFEATYEENWGTRFERVYHTVLFATRPSRAAAIKELEKKYPQLGKRGGLQEKWFDYGPLSLREKPIEILP